MTPYGDAPRLGDTIDPRLMAQDFSGFARAGAIKGQALANLGQNIGDIIKMRGEQKKQDATNEKFLKQAVDVFKGTPLEESISAAYQNYTSEDTTDRERRAIGASIRETIGLGMQAQEMKRQQELLNLRRAEVAAKGRGDAVPTPEEQARNIEASLRIMGAIPEYSPLAAKIRKEMDDAKDPMLKMQIGSYATSIASQLKPTTLDPKAPDVRTADDVTRQFRSGLSQANQYGINVSQEDEAAFNLAVMQGDMGAAKEIADRIQGQVEAQSKVAMEEQKELVQLVDGSQILVGEKTGNRYDPATRSVIPVEDPRSSQNVYVAESMTAQQEREKAFKEIRNLISQGKDDEALDKYRGLKSGGMVFSTATPEDLKAVFSQDFIRRGMK
jgi:hypothetical protein